MEDKVKIFISSFYYDEVNEKWNCYPSDYRPPDDEYYEVTIPVPSKEVKEQKGEIKGQVTVDKSQLKQNNDS